MKPSRKRKRPDCAIIKVWAYPATEDKDGTLHWAWACRCGKHAHGIATKVLAHREAATHFDANQIQLGG